MIALRRRARQRLTALSAERLRVALDFLAYLEERESSAATDELLRIPGFVETLKSAEEETPTGRWTDQRKIRRDVQSDALAVGAVRTRRASEDRSS